MDDAVETEVRLPAGEAVPVLPASGRPVSTSGLRVALLLALALGVAMRVWPALTSSFVPGDGGMFFITIRDIEKSAFVLPHFISYNAGHIPFGYPPVGFYVLAGLNHFLGIPEVTLFRFLPAVVTICTLPVFLLIARALLPSEVAVVGAMVAYGVSAEAFDWEIMGGGVTRSFGLLFALLAVYALIRLYQTSEWKFVAPAVVFSTFTILSHLEWSWFLVTTGIVLAAAYVRDRTRAGQTAVVLAATAAFISPWLLMLASRYGLSTLTGTFTGSEGIDPFPERLFSLLTVHFTEASGFDVLVALALIGILVCICRLQFLIPAWIVVVYLLTSRGPVDKAVVPLALAAGIGLQALLGILRSSQADSSLGARGRRRLGVGIGAVFAVFLLQTCLYMLALEHTLDGSLTSADRQSMAWIAHHTPHSAVILTVGPGSASDYVPEWLPALTHHRDPSVPQGTEWIPHGYLFRMERQFNLSACSHGTVRCLDRWMARYHIRPALIYLEASKTRPARTCCAALDATMLSSQRYQPVLRRGGVTVWRVGGNPADGAPQRASGK